MIRKRLSTRSVDFLDSVLFKSVDFLKIDKKFDKSIWTSDSEGTLEKGDALCDLEC